MIYVKPDGNDSASGISWELAKRTLQGGADAAGSGTTILVSNGVYASGGAVVDGQSSTNRLVLGEGVSMKSVGGLAVIDGQNLVRGFYLKQGAKLSEFAVTRSKPLGKGSSWRDRAGGGGYLEERAEVNRLMVVYSTITPRRQR